MDIEFRLGNLKGRKTSGRQRYCWEDNIKMDFNETKREAGDKNSSGWFL
jgi:hypothetical protein